MKTQHSKISGGCEAAGLRCIVFILLLLHTGIKSWSQCPPNLDFEKGNFDGWFCDTGRIMSNGQINLNSSPPFINRHTIISTITDAADYWGGFPRLCPNGSGYSIRLGNDVAENGAERVYYTFIIPPDRDKFTLYYNYAMVLEDPGHLAFQQPKLSIEVYNVTDQQKDTCSSFNFISTGGLPGFFVSPKSDPAIPVRCKDWSASSINLDGNAGKTIRISFTITDCSLGEHFGYAYIDINTGCSSTLAALYCPSDPVVTLTGPPGFQNYKWFDKLNTTIGTSQKITFAPPPLGGDSVYLEVVPFSGYGCSDTLTAYLWDTISVIANAGPDLEFCIDKPIQLGGPARPGLRYEWSPATALNNSKIANPLVTPTVNTQYKVTATTEGGGCQMTDVVNLVKRCDVIELYVPNAFVPGSINGNGTLRPFLYGFNKVNYFRVYNRAGQLVYSANNDFTGWDGTIKGKQAPPQTVVWVIEAVDAYGRIQKRQGTSILIR